MVRLVDGLARDSDSSILQSMKPICIRIHKKMADLSVEIQMFMIPLSVEGGRRTSCSFSKNVIQQSTLNHSALQFCQFIWYSGLQDIKS